MLCHRKSKTEKPFEQLLNKAVTDLAPNGLVEIESKALLLLNSKQIIIMEKLKYLIGFIGSVALTGGAIFKLLHLPGANELFMISYLTFLLVFFPFLAFEQYKVNIAKMLPERLTIILGVVSSVVLGSAGIVKIGHLQASHWLLMIGIIIFAAGFLPFFFFTMYKRSIS